MREAKEALHTGMAGAERMIRSGLQDAKETVKNELKDAVSNAGFAARRNLRKSRKLATEVGDTMNDA
jgi:hypothetical protein